MDDSRFDAIARALAGVATRRGALAALAALAGIPVKTAARKRHHDHPATRRQVQVEARCRLNGSPCTTGAQCCSRKCEGGKGRKKCKSCMLKACSSKADLCRGGAICGCKGNPDCACWTGIGGDQVCASLPYGVCAPCENDATCEGLSGVAGSRCIKADDKACGCKSAGNPRGTACVAPCGQRCIPRGVDCENDPRSCCSGKCGCTAEGCFCRDAHCAGFDQPCTDTDWWTDCCEGRCAGEAGAGFCTPQGHCSSRGEICADTKPCCSGVCDWRETPHRCRQSAGAACRADDHCWAESFYPARCVEGTCCTPPGETCASSAECCKGECEQGVCQTPFGDTCGATRECSGWQNGTIACRGSWVVEHNDVVYRGRCAVRPGGACASPESCQGDECRDGRCCLHSPSDYRTCTQDDQCCDGICLRESCCQPMGAACTGVNQCCNGRSCEDGRCCIGGGSGCEYSTECCGDLVCSGGACCRGIGHPCGGGPAGCCIGMGCDRDLGTCVSCLESGKTCSYSTECCGDLVCDHDAGCVTCLAEGARCVPYSWPNECCEGLVCGGPTNNCVRPDQ